VKSQDFDGMVKKEQRIVTILFFRETEPALSNFDFHIMDNSDMSRCNQNSY